MDDARAGLDYTSLSLAGTDGLDGWVGLEVLKDSHCMHLLVARTAWHFSVMEEVDLYFLSRSVLFVPLVSNLHSYLICVSL